MSTNDEATQFDVAAKFTETICSKLDHGRGVHAETAISAASRMAGTLVLRSCGLPLSGLEPGSHVSSDAINERALKVLGVVGQTLSRLEVPFDPAKIDGEVRDEHRPELGLSEVQSLLNLSFHTILEKSGLTAEQGAYAAAIASATLIQLCARILDPQVGYTIASFGIMEGCKTVPVTESDGQRRVNSQARGEGSGAIAA